MPLKLLTYTIRYGWSNRLPLTIDLLRAQNADASALVEPQTPKREDAASSSRLNVLPRMN